MTDLAITTQGTLSEFQVSLPTVQGAAETTAYATLDAAGRLVSGIENTLDATANIVNTALPETVRFVGSFLLPEKFNNVLSTATEYGTWLATWTTVASIKGATQALTFGLPAWMDTARYNVGVNQASSELIRAETAEDILARSFIENVDEPLIKESLTNYVSLRRELKNINPDGSEAATERLSEISKQLAHLEIKLRDYHDFSALKAILEQRQEFVQQQHSKILSLARSTAERVIEDVEGFYKEKAGPLGGTLDGKWAKAATEEERTALRAQYTDKIASHLMRVFEQNLTTEETQRELARVKEELHSAFGTYGKAIKAGLYSVLGVGYATGALAYAANAASNAVGEYVHSAVDYVSDSISSTLTGIRDGISSYVYTTVDQMNEHMTKVATDMVANNPVVHAVSSGIDTAYDFSDTVSTTISNGVESVDNAVGDFFSGGAHNYSSPYWTGTDRVFMGYVDGQPVYGHSCISGFPSVSRLESMTADYSSLTELVRPEHVDLETLLQPGDKLPQMNEDNMAILMDFLNQK